MADAKNIKEEADKIEKLLKDEGIPYKRSEATNDMNVIVPMDKKTAQAIADEANNIGPGEKARNFSTTNQGLIAHFEGGTSRLIDNGILQTATTGIIHEKFARHLFADILFHNTGAKGLNLDNAIVDDKNHTITFSYPPEHKERMRASAKQFNQEMGYEGLTINKTGDIILQIKPGDKLEDINQLTGKLNNVLISMNILATRTPATSPTTPTVPEPTTPPATAPIPDEAAKAKYYKEFAAKLDSILGIQHATGAMPNVVGNKIVYDLSKQKNSESSPSNLAKKLNGTITEALSKQPKLYARMAWADDLYHSVIGNRLEIDIPGYVQKSDLKKESELLDLFDKCKTDLHTASSNAVMQIDPARYNGYLEKLENILGVEKTLGIKPTVVRVDPNDPLSDYIVYDLSKDGKGKSLPDGLAETLYASITGTVKGSEYDHISIDRIVGYDPDKKQLGFSVNHIEDRYPNTNHFFAKFPKKSDELASQAVADAKKAPKSEKTAAAKGGGATAAPGQAAGDDEEKDFWYYLKHNKNMGIFGLIGALIGAFLGLGELGMLAGGFIGGGLGALKDGKNGAFGLEVADMSHRGGGRLRHNVRNNNPAQNRQQYGHRRNKNNGLNGKQTSVDAPAGDMQTALNEARSDIQPAERLPAAVADNDLKARPLTPVGAMPDIVRQFS